MKQPSLWSLLREIHEDEEGAVVSLDTVLVLCVIAIPCLFFLIKFGWPKIKDYFMKGMDDLQGESDKAKMNQY